MADVSASFESILLTYRDVREANPNWTDRMIEDYLSLKRDVATAADSGISPAELAALYERIEALESYIPTIVYTNADYAVSDSPANITMWNSTAKTVTLPVVPTNGQVVRVKRTDAQVTIDGNGSTIDGQSEVILNRQYVSLSLLYNTSSGAWSII